MTPKWPSTGRSSRKPARTPSCAELLAHQAGCPRKPPLTLHDLADTARVGQAAAQAPAWTPGTRHGYHAITLGWYEGELNRRADPAGRSLGRFFAEEIAKPLDLDFYIGLPTSVNRDRVAHSRAWSRAKMLLHLNTMPPASVLGSFNPFGLTARSCIIAKGVNGIRTFQPRANYG